MCILVNLDQKILHLGARVKIRTETRRYKDVIGIENTAPFFNETGKRLCIIGSEEQCNKFVDHLIGIMMEARCKVVTHKD